MNPVVLMNDLQEGINYQLETNKGSGDINADFDYGKYHTLEEIQGWVEDITKTYPNIADMVSIVKSFEGREMLAIQIRSNSSSNKAGIWIEGGIHAREWISPATVIYMAGKLLEGYGEVENITKAIDAFDWYIVPVVNVDGYKYTWTGDRNWRKTRTKHLLCYGSDPNRNWDNHWCNGEASGGHNPCSDVYCGPKPFSEPVVKGVADFILSKPSGYFKIFIDFHSYSQLWMTPWGYTKAKPKDYEQQEASSAATVKALTAVHGTKYIYGPIASTIYVASGSSADWTYANASIKYSYGVELRDQGQYGFLLPADQIIPSGEETLQGLLTLTQFVQNNP
ncbi:carboxypeptidase B [Patella vulgata]|uniref:carboxypeptidase B n=1 Tax=Patella vulgata TaxID=6465 RepID=UPI00217F7D58|nr:carboxypeptidase B [Patella vulgata]